MLACERDLPMSPGPKDPHGVGTTTINGVNDHGQLVGFYLDGANNTDGFLAAPQR